MKVWLAKRGDLPRPCQNPLTWCQGYGIHPWASGGMGLIARSPGIVARLSHVPLWTR